MTHAGIQGALAQAEEQHGVEGLRDAFHLQKISRVQCVGQLSGRHRLLDPIGWDRRHAPEAGGGGPKVERCDRLAVTQRADAAVDEGEVGSPGSVSTSTMTTVFDLVNVIAATSALEEIHIRLRGRGLLFTERNRFGGVGDGAQ